MGPICSVSCCDSDTFGFSRISQSQISNQFQIYRKKQHITKILGLPNLGNTCYLNSALQSISRNHSVQTYFKIQNPEASLDLETCNVSKGFREFVKCQQENRRNLPVLKQLLVASPQFKSGFPQDSHEFLEYFLNELNEDVLTKGVYDLFFGELVSSVKCGHCATENSQIEPFISLSLTIPQKREVSLSDCVEYFLCQETLSDSENLACGVCQTRSPALKSLQIMTFPKVLILHLKRFLLLPSYGWVKSTQLVSYPFHGFDLSKFSWKQEGMDSIYDLVSVIEHIGGINSGHYTSEVLNQDSNLWFSYDDEDVFQLEAEETSQFAYVLLYQKRGKTGSGFSTADSPETYD